MLARRIAFFAFSQILLLTSLEAAHPRAVKQNVQSVQNVQAGQSGQGESCLVNADCYQDLVCERKKCVVPVISQSCNRTADCESPARCIDNICVKPKENDAARNNETVKNTEVEGNRRIITPAPTYRETPATNYQRNTPEEEGVPAGMHIETRRKKWLLTTGLAVFVPTYVVTFAATTGMCLSVSRCADPVIPLSFLPVFGTLAMIAFTKEEKDSERFIALEVMSSLLQAGSLAMMIAGMVIKEKVLVFDRPEASGAIVPVVGPGYVGLSLNVIQH